MARLRRPTRRAAPKNSDKRQPNCGPLKSFVLIVSAPGRTHACRMDPQASIETATQLAVFLGNRPGALSRVCTELAAAEINILALATSDTIDHAVVRMVVSDPTKALMILGERGVLALENDVLLIESNNEPGMLATIADRLAKAGINIEYAYLATSPKSQQGLMVLRPSDVEKAERALHDL